MINNNDFQQNELKIKNLDQNDDQNQAHVLMLLEKEIQNAFNYQEHQNFQFENLFLIIYQFPMLVQKINEDDKEKIILKKSEKNEFLFSQVITDLIKFFYNKYLKSNDEKLKTTFKDKYEAYALKSL